MWKLLLPFCLMAGISQAATIPAASCLQADVQAAVDVSVDGDVVTVPAGQCEWSSFEACGSSRKGLCVQKGITILGAGIGQTVITSTVGSTIFANVDEPKSWRVSGFTFLGGARNSYIEITGTSKAWRIDNNRFVDWAASSAINVTSRAYGVIDHNEFLQSGVGSRVINVTEEMTTEGSYAAWQRPYSPGSADAVYIEDNIFSAGEPTQGSSVCNGDGGARIVLRYNQIHNMNFGGHGTDSGTRRGTFSTEAYGNKFSNDCTSGMARAINNRSGASIYFDNTVTGCWNTLATLNVHRTWTDFAATWRMADGTKWGVCSNDWSKVAAQASDCGVGATLLMFCSTSRDTLVSSDSECPTGETASHAFDEVADGEILAARDQAGRATNQELVGVWAWNNSFCSGSVGCTPIANAGVIVVQPSGPYADQTNLLQGGRDYFNNVKKPGYTPYTYPHPLVSDTVEPVEDAPDVPLPPTNLRKTP